MDLMKSWIDKCQANDHIWLVLVFHGVDNFGWEPKTAKELEEYFSYIKEKENDLWVATFADVTKYIRERKNTDISSKLENETIALSLSSDLDPEIYDVPLTFKTYVPGNWESAKVMHGEKEIASNLEIRKDDRGHYILYDFSPLRGKIIISATI